MKKTLLVSGLASLTILGACNQVPVTPTDTPTDTAGESSSSEAAMMPESSSSSAASSASGAVAMPGDNMPVSKKYTDGTYSADGSYMSPAGQEAVTISLTLKDDMITDVTFQGLASNEKSIELQAQFAAGFKEQVIGKSIDELSLTVVNGSSLTPQGFMDAVEKIKVQAKAAA